MKRRSANGHVRNVFIGSLNRGVLILFVGMAVFIAAAELSPPAEAAYPGGNGKITFASMRDGDSDIYVANADGSDVVNLTHNTSWEISPAWSPDGTKIAFASTIQGGATEIYVMKSDGTRVVRLTNSPFDDLWPSWSPDGKQIVFTSWRDGYGELYSMNADGTNQVRLTVTTESEENPVWSPDGSQIAFSRRVDDRNQIFIMSSTGGEQTQFTTVSKGAEYPDWSPDGSKILFVGRSEEWVFDIYHKTLGGSDVIQVTDTPEQEYMPIWSPDGSKIAYVVETIFGRMDINTANADGTNSVDVMNHSLDDYYPDWQPVVPQPLRIYVSAVAPGTTSNGLAYGVGDILQWDGAQWSIFYSSRAASLSTANVNAFEVPDATERDVFLNFSQSSVKAPGVGGTAAAHDIIAYDGISYRMVFDGSDEGLTTAGEKIDALAVLDGRLSPIGDHCKNYLLISTTAGGSVENTNGDDLSFGGEDILGFCQWNVGANTAGLWHKLVDGSSEGLPAGSIVSISATDDGLVVYFTTKATFNVDGVAGQPSKVYSIDMVTREINGPHWNDVPTGFSGAIDGLHIIGELP